MRKALRTVIWLGGLVVLTAALGATPAVAADKAPAKKKAPPCWKLLVQDWYQNGRVDNVYPIPCYREAINHLPTDVQTYSSAREDINRALQAAIAARKSGTTTRTTGTTRTTTGRASATPPPGGKSGGGGTSAGGTSGGGGKSAGGGSSSSSSSSTSTGAGGPFATAIKDIGPKSADSVPIPLLVLGGIALLLLAAGGAGFLARRAQARRVQGSGGNGRISPSPDGNANS